MTEEKKKILYKEFVAQLSCKDYNGSIFVFKIPLRRKKDRVEVVTINNPRTKDCKVKISFGDGTSETYQDNGGLCIYYADEIGLRNYGPASGYTHVDRNPDYELEFFVGLDYVI